MKLRTLPTRIGNTLILGSLVAHLSNDESFDLSQGLTNGSPVALDVKARTTEGMIETDNMFELHPPGTLIKFNGEVFTVGDDGFWRNELGMEPAGQRTPPVELPRHCPGCRCGQQGPPTGRMQHGGSL